MAAEGGRSGEDSGCVWAYVYDAQNRLLSAVSNSVTIATFAYDARAINSVTTYLTYDSWNLLEERNGSGTLRKWLATSCNKSKQSSLIQGKLGR